MPETEEGDGKFVDRAGSAGDVPPEIPYGNARRGAATAAFAAAAAAVFCLTGKEILSLVFSVIAVLAAVYVLTILSRSQREWEAALPILRRAVDAMRQSQSQGQDTPRRTGTAP